MEKSYSLDEQDTGQTWIDGKKIYQRTVDCGGVFGWGAGIYTAAHKIAHLLFLVDARGTSFNGTDFMVLPLVIGSAESQQFNTGFWLDRANICNS